MIPFTKVGSYSLGFHVQRIAKKSAYYSKRRNQQKVKKRQNNLRLKIANNVGNLQPLLPDQFQKMHAHIKTEADKLGKKLKVPTNYESRIIT